LRISKSARVRKMANIVNSDGLPYSVVTLIEHIGEAATLAIVKKWGGRILYVPVEISEPPHPENHQLLIDQIGQTATEKLIKVYAGEPQYIAKCKAAMLRRVWRKIQAEFDNPKTADELALEYGLCTRQIFNILKKPTDPKFTKSAQSGQFDLFSNL
jgi:Mor family transcriptional regulator